MFHTEGTPFMSSTTFYGIQKDTLGVPKVSVVLGEYKNSHLAGPTIWNIMAKEYSRFGSVPLAEKDSKEFWNSWKNPVMPDWLRIVILSTYDHVYVKRGNWSRLTEAMNKFTDHYKDNNNHCQAYVEALSNASEDIIGCCWCITSLSDDPWRVWNEKTQEDEIYDLNIGTKHWELFDTCLDPWKTVSKKTGINAGSVCEENSHV